MTERDGVPRYAAASYGARAGLDRRQFVARGGSFAALTMTGGLGALLSACGGGGDGPGAIETARQTGVLDEDPSALAEPSTIYSDVLSKLPKGGSAEIGLSEQVSNTLNPLTNSLGATGWMAFPAHDFLEMYNEKGVLRPSLAESLELPDATTLRYRLHEAATFHNGRAVTSRDVKQTFEWIQDPKNKSWLVDSLRGVRVETPDDRTAVLRLATPDVGFRHILPRVPIVPVETMDQQATNPIGCGPFVFSRFVRDSYVDYTRNPRYWNPEAPRVDRLRLTLYAEAQAAGEAFLAGKGDYLSQVPNAQVPAFVSRAESEGFETDVLGGGWTYLRFYDLSAPPFDDVRVRQAAALCLDREGMAQTAFNGISRPVWSMVDPESPYYADELEYARDVAQAKRLMTEAGLADGVDGGKLTTVQVDYMQDLAVSVQANLREIGIETEVEAVDIPTYIDLRNRKRLNLGILGDEVAPDPGDPLTQHFVTGGARNPTAYSNRKFDRLVAQARRIADLERRAELFQQAQRIVLVEDYAAVPLTEESTMGLYRDGTNGDQYHPYPRFLWHYPIVAVGA